MSISYYTDTKGNEWRLQENGESNRGTCYFVYLFDEDECHYVYKGIVFTRKHEDKDIIYDFIMQD